MPAGFGAGHLSMSPVCSSAPIPRGGGTAPRSAPCLGAHGTAALHSQELEAGFFPKTLGLFFFFHSPVPGGLGYSPGAGQTSLQVRAGMTGLPRKVAACNPRYSAAGHV